MSQDILKKSSTLPRRKSLGLSRNSPSTRNFNSPAAKNSIRGTDNVRRQNLGGTAPAEDEQEKRPRRKGNVVKDITAGEKIGTPVQLKPSSRKRFVSPFTTNTPLGRKRFKTDFKSPVRSIDDPATLKESLKKVSDEITDVRNKLDVVNKEIKNLEDSGCNLGEMDLHLDRIHQYNELKDLGQHLIGQIAMKNGTTTSQEYPRFGLDLND